MAATIITLYPAHGTPSTIVLRDMLPVQPAAGTTIVLWPVTASTVVLRDPADMDVGGSTTLIATRVDNVTSFGAHSLTHRLLATRADNTSTAGAHQVNLRLLATAQTNVSTFGNNVVDDGSAPAPATGNRLSRPLTRALTRKLAA